MRSVKNTCSDEGHLTVGKASDHGGVLSLRLFSLDTQRKKTRPQAEAELMCTSSSRTKPEFDEIRFEK